MDINTLLNKYVPEFVQSNPKDKSFLSFLFWGKQVYPDKFLSIEGDYIEPGLGLKFKITEDVDSLIKKLKGQAEI